MSLPQGFEQADEVLGVVVLARHEVSAAEVEPFYFVEPFAELAFYMLQGMIQGVRCAFAVAVAMEAFNAFGQDFRQFVSGDAEARAGGAGVVEFSLYLAVFGIDTQTARYAGRRGARRETGKLRERVERDMTAILHDVSETVLFVCRGISVCL